jgi:Ca2+-binding RTX toxin-like protein
MGGPLVIDGGADNDTLTAHTEATLIGDGGSDTLTGSDWNDLLNGGTEVDTLDGKDGSDDYEWRSGDGRDSYADTGPGFSGGGGGDLDRIAVFSDMFDGLQTEFSSAAVGDGGTGIEGITFLTDDFSSQDNPFIIGTNNAEHWDFTDTFFELIPGTLTIQGLGGEDEIIGPNFMGGPLVIDGGADNDTLTAHTEATLIGGDGVDTLNGSHDSDVLIGGDGVDLVNGGEGDDVFFAGLAYDDGSDDQYYGGDGSDTIDYTDVTSDLEIHLGVIGTATDSTASIGGLDQVNDIENVDAGSGNDMLFGGAEANVFNGNAGNDQLSGDAGNDTLHGGADNDILRGGADADELWGDAGEDVFDFTDVDNNGVGDGTDDILDFEQGADLIQLSAIYGPGGAFDLFDSDTSQGRVIDGSTIDTVVLQNGDAIFVTTGTGVSLASTDFDFV